MNEEQEYIIGASLSNAIEKVDEFKVLDPFNKSWDELKNLNNLTQNFKRKTSRAITKGLEQDQRYMSTSGAINQGIDGAQSKSINPGRVFRNGYGLFDVITPDVDIYL